MNLKKTLPEIKKNNPDKEIFYFDESRFGTHSKIGHAWFKTGTRPRVKIKLGFKNFYLYCAINPKTGEEFTLILPKVNKELMKLFMTEFYKKYKGRNIIMIMDGAGWHKDKSYLLQDTKNIEIVLQPPYSPELNPVERLWQYIKNHTIKNKIHKTLDDLESEICKFFNDKIDDNIIKNVCRVDY
jgi:transposase